MSSARVQAILRHPAVGVLLLYVFGVVLRVDYSLRVHLPERFIHADMQMYVELARRIAAGEAPVSPWDVTHPLGYPALLAALLGPNGWFARAVVFQIFISSLIPLAMGLLGLVTFGRRTALAALAVASLYFPFIEYGALFLSEVHFILCLTLAFAGFFAARNADRRGVSLAFAAGGGFALSLAAALKSVALPAAAAFFVMDAIALALAARGTRQVRARLLPWLLRSGIAVVATLPILGWLARVCTRANAGNFCLTGNKPGSDFLLGHYGEIADIEWIGPSGHSFRFGSPSAHMRHYEQHVKVPFDMTDNAANTAEAWRWIRSHPFDALVLSFDHVYDTFFGVAMWPSWSPPSWQVAHLSQYFFVLFLFVPTVIACLRFARRGARAFLQSRTALVLSPVAALIFTVAIATGEVRYRIPFDIFFIALTCALFTGEHQKLDGVGPDV